MRLKKITEDLSNYMPDTSCSYNYGECSVEVLRAAKKALINNIKDFKIIDGVVYLDGSNNAIPHTWIEYKGQIYDPTVSQFGGHQVEYDPDGEYKDEYSPIEFIDTYEEIYGIDPKEVT